jgi:hypothetical protein
VPPAPRPSPRAIPAPLAPSAPTPPPPPPPPDDRVGLLERALL